MLTFTLSTCRFLQITSCLLQAIQILRHDYFIHINHVKEFSSQVTLHVNCLGSHHYFNISFQFIKYNFWCTSLVQQIRFDYKIGLFPGSLGNGYNRILLFVQVSQLLENASIESELTCILQLGGNAVIRHFNVEISIEANRGRKKRNQIFSKIIRAKGSQTAAN